MKLRRGIFLVCSLLLVGFATLTPGGRDSRSALAGNFWCVACDPLAGADIVVNTLLFIPLGAALALFSESILVVLVAALMSAAIETLQHYAMPAGRDANITDVLSNTFGAFIGTQLSWRWRAWLLPDQRRARALATAGACGAILALVWTAWALGRDVSPTAFEQSAMPFTPGFGWYHGFVHNARIRGVDYAHRGDGPLILQGALAARESLSVLIEHHDERRELVPALYLHHLNDTLPELIIGQSGADARIRVALRAQRWRLASLELVLRSAFVDRQDVRTINAVIAPEDWNLASVQGSVTTQAQLPLTLGLGWALLQHAVALENSAAPLVLWAWFLVLFAPVGYWCAMTGRGAWAFVVGAALSIGAVLFVVPGMAALSPTSSIEWIDAAVGFVVGVGCGTLVERRRFAV